MIYENGKIPVWSNFLKLSKVCKTFWKISKVNLEDLHIINFNCLSFSLGFLAFWRFIIEIFLSNCIKIKKKKWVESIKNDRCAIFYQYCKSQKYLLVGFPNSLNLLVQIILASILIWLYTYQITFITDLF